MNPLLLGEVYKIGAGLIERFFPDPAAAQAAKIELFKMQQSGELAALAASTDLAKAQIAVNQAEASSGSLFIAGWRPSVGWICVLGLFYEFLLSPLLPWALTAFGHPVPDLPDLPTETLMTLLLGMLGLGGMRTVEKIKGAEGNR